MTQAARALAPTVAALYVETGGVYYDLDGVDPWDEARDARAYPGPHPVVAHPPCARWGRYWSGGPSAKVRRELGDDGGCFEAALRFVRLYGGVLEHPANTAAWRFFSAGGMATRASAAPARRSSSLLRTPGCAARCAATPRPFPSMRGNETR